MHGPQMMRKPRRFPAGRRRGRRVQPGLRDSKTLALYRAALSLLAAKDFDDISVSRLARAGGCSVGAFYGRFADKRRFLEFVISETFREASRRAESALSETAAGGGSLVKAAEGIAGQISGQFADDEFAGVVRAAVKLGFSDPKSRAPFEDYRAAVTERAAALLKPILGRGGEDRVRAAMQAAFGILTDAAISRTGRLRPGATPMDAALTAVITNLAGSGGKSAGKSRKDAAPKSENAREQEEASPRAAAEKLKARKLRVL